ncbi:hypothetical protein [Nostoc sp. TCL26-01]|nr:hypothetical protein [Nostoc sp. TCL26-01]
MKQNKPNLKQQEKIRNINLPQLDEAQLTQIAGAADVEYKYVSIRRY